MKTTAGFTLIEVMVALIILGVGILALSGSSAMVNRMIGRGRVGNSCRGARCSQGRKLQNGCSVHVAPMHLAQL